MLSDLGLVSKILRGAAISSIMGRKIPYHMVGGNSCKILGMWLLPPATFTDHLQSPLLNTIEVLMFGFETGHLVLK